MTSGTEYGLYIQNTNNVFSTTGAVARTPLNILYANTAYSSELGLINIARSGALTGVDTETIIDFNIEPGFTLTEPGSGSVDFIGTNIDLGNIAVTAGAGTSSITGLRITASDDADVGESLAIDARGASKMESIIGTQGTDIASASTIVIPRDGNTFELTGVTAVNLITTTGYQDGFEITLVANENVTINHGTATSGSNVTILLSGADNFSMTANDTLKLVLSSTTAGGQAWREVSRTGI